MAADTNAKEVKLKDRVAVYGTGKGHMAKDKLYMVSPLIADNLVNTGHATKEKPKTAK